MHRGLVSLILLALVVPAAAGAQTPGNYSERNFKLTAMVGPNGDQKCTIDARIYRPNGVDAARPAPAILATNGFGGNKDEFKTLAPSYANRGYVFLSYSGLGFGESTCKIELDNPNWDGKAASALIDYLGGGRPDDGGTRIDYVIRDSADHAGGSTPNDPRVGMIGGSYGGQVQFAAAGVDPRLDTIIPQITWNDLAYSLSPNNSSFLRGVTYAPTAPGVEKYQWTSLFFAVGLAGSRDPGDAGACPNFNDRACQIKAQMDATGYADEAGIAFAREASVTSYMRDIRIPTFVVQGENDTLFNLNEAVATYEALRAQGTPAKMLWRSAGHSGGGLGKSENDEGNPEAAYASRAYLEWFDFYLRGVGDAPRLDFSYYRPFVPFPEGRDAAASVATASAYPVAGGQDWFLSGDGALAPTPEKIKAGAPSFSFAAQAATSYSETSGGVANQPPTDGPGTFAAFTSPPLAEDADVVGIPRVTVSLSAPVQAAAQGQPGGRLVLFAKLYEVKPDGTKVLPNRLISPVRVADVTKPVTITLPGIVHRFAKGSKFQLVLAASDSAYKNNYLAGQVSVPIDPKAPRALTIPVLGAGAAPVPVAAPGGSQSPGAGQQPQVAAEGQRTQAASLTPRRRCKRNRRVIVVRIVGVKKPDFIVSKKVTLNGKRVKLRRGGARIDLRKRRAGIYRVFVLVKSKRGKIRRSARSYKVC